MVTKMVNLRPFGKMNGIKCGVFGRTADLLVIYWQNITSTKYLASQSTIKNVFSCSHNGKQQDFWKIML